MNKKITSHILLKFILIVIVPESIFLITYWLTINPAEKWYEYLLGVLSSLGLWISFLSAIAQLFGKGISNWLGLDFFQIKNKFLRLTHASLRTINNSLPIIGHIKRPESKQLWDFVKNNKNIILRGVSGSGKSALLKEVVDYAKTEKFIVLLIIATSIESNVNNIDELKSHLELSKGFIDSLEKINNYQKCLVIFDQIDNINNNQLISLIHHIFSLSIGLNNVMTIGVCENINLPEFLIINELNFPEFKIDELSFKEVDEILNFFGIHFSSTLKKLSRRFIFLNLVLKIYEENHNLEISSYIQLFETYTSTISKRIGNEKFHHLSYLAYETLIDERLVFSIPSSKVDQLTPAVKNNILIKINNRKYKFFHEQIHLIFATHFSFENALNFDEIYFILLQFNSIYLILWLIEDYATSFL